MHPGTEETVPGCIIWNYRMDHGRRTRGRRVDARKRIYAKGVEDKKRARSIHAVVDAGEIVLFLARLSIYSSLMNQVWLFLFLPRPRARLLLWAGRFLSVPPRLHPGIKRERERRGEGSEKERYFRATFGLSLARAPEFFSQLVFLI